LGKTRSGIFLQTGLDRNFGDLPVGQNQQAERAPALPDSIRLYDTQPATMLLKRRTPAYVCDMTARARVVMKRAVEE
jgi:hypothetical protein